MQELYGDVVMKLCLPKCANLGCNNHVSIRSGNIADGTAKLRPTCDPCHRGRNKNKNVESFRKGLCSNHDDHFGFPCLTDHSRLGKEMVKGSFHIDHIDGNRFNNEPDNLQELCAHCHQEKGIRNGDFCKPRMRRIAEEQGMKINLDIFCYD
jgi:hypothetical protein